MRSDAAFWRFSLRAYRAPGVAEACLALQDECGADVNLLLFCAWLGHRGRRLSARELRAAIALVSPWQSGVVRPLREARRSISKEDKTLKRLRKRIAAVELRAERAEQSLLGAFAAKLPAARRVPPTDATRANLEGYLKALGVKSRGARREREGRALRGLDAQTFARRSPLVRVGRRVRGRM